MTTPVPTRFSDDELAIIDGYGHQDVFMGARVDREVFPRLMTFLNAHA